jgi:hypothetical protein
MLHSSGRMKGCGRSERELRVVIDDLQDLINTYRLRSSSSASKVSVLRHVERIRDPRVVPFLLEVLGDPREVGEVRIHLIRQLRNGDGLVSNDQRSVVARAISVVLTDEPDEQLRLEAALALGEFTQIDGVLSTLGGVALAQNASIDLRYAAFTSLERAGATSASVSLMRVLASDEILGNSARGLMSTWHVD